MFKNYLKKNLFELKNFSWYISTKNNYFQFIILFTSIKLEKKKTDVNEEISANLLKVIFNKNQSI